MCFAPKVLGVQNTCRILLILFTYFEVLPYFIYDFDASGEHGLDCTPEPEGASPEIGMIQRGVSCESMHMQAINFASLRVPTPTEAASHVLVYRAVLWGRL